MNTKSKWSKYKPFPNPAHKDYLHAPFGPGVYELMNFKTNELVYVGEGGNVAHRMSSLLPAPLGAGTRNNLNLRKYISDNLDYIKYHTLACNTKKEAKSIQDEMIKNNKYLFN